MCVAETWTFGAKSGNVRHIYLTYSTFFQLVRVGSNLLVGVCTVFEKHKMLVISVKRFTTRVGEFVSRKESLPIVYNCLCTAGVPMHSFDTWLKGVSSMYGVQILCGCFVIARISWASSLDVWFSYFCSTQWSYDLTLYVHRFSMEMSSGKSVGLFQQRMLMIVRHTVSRSD